MEAKSLQEAWRRQSFFSFLVVLAVAIGALVPILTLVVKERNEHRMLTRGEAISSAYRERILSNDIQYVETSAGSSVKDIKRVKILDKNFELIYRRPTESFETLHCSKKICWNLMELRVTSFTPIYFSNMGGDISAYVMLESNVDIDWFLITILFASIVFVLFLQSYLLWRQTKATSITLGKQVRVWTQQLHVDPKSVRKQVPPFAELQPLSQSLSRLGMQIEKYEKESELATVKSLSHDLLTPLSQVSNYLYMIEEDLKENKYPDQAKIEPLQKSISRMKSLASQMCRLADIRPISFEQVDLREVLSDVGQRYCSTKENRHFFFDLPARASLNTSKDHLYRIFENLVSNAFEAGASLVRVSFTPLGKYFVLRISDDGAGIEPAKQPFLFLPGSTSKNGSNFGLGLATVNKLCSDIGMTISFVETNSGATFELGGSL